MAAASPVLAHPPYEHLERVVTDDSGQSLYLSKSYVDGIFFTDPVKLVVRDRDERTVVETEYGRDLSVVCWPPRPCVVFRYEGTMPVLPQNVWRFHGGQLQQTRSPGLIALGVVAPLWDHVSGYLFSFVWLGVPFLVLWPLWRSHRSTPRPALVSVVSMGAVLYVVIWLYTVVLLSYLSLPLVIAVCVTGGVLLLLAYRAALRVGVADSTLLRLTRVSAIIVVALAGAAVIALIGLFVKMAFYSASIAFDEPPVQAPLAKASVTRAKGTTSEVFVTVARGVKLQDVVNLDLFEGFEAAMPREVAEQRLGPPSGRWTDPVYRVLQASYYDRRDGRVSIVRQGASTWSTVGHPSGCTHDYVFRDRRLRDQLLQWLPAQDVVQVNVLRDVGWGGLTVHLNRTSCSYLVLTARDGDPDPR
jgi:hypothetical protein